MKNQKDKIDLLFRKEMEYHELETPPELREKFFNKLQTSRDKDKKRRNILIVFILLFVSSIAVISLHYYLGSEANETTKTISYKNTNNKSLKNESKTNTINENKNDSEINDDKNSVEEVNKTNNVNETKPVNSKKDKPQNIVLERDKHKKSLKSDNKTNETDGVIEEKPNIIVNEDYSVSIKKDNNELSNPLPERVLFIESIKRNSLDTFSIYNDGIYDQMIKDIFFKPAFILSVGLYAGHSIIQSPMLNVSKTNNDDNHTYSYKMDWPSGFVGLNFKFEKKHFFMDFGLQLSKFTENIKTDYLLSNPSETQIVSITGQNSIIDTSMGYYEYFIISDSNIRIIDSTWNSISDTSFTNILDTLNKTIYDTLRSPSWKNSYTFIDMPILFGWQKSFGKSLAKTKIGPKQSIRRFSIGVKTGPVLNLMITTRQLSPLKYNNEIILSDIKDNFKKYQLGLSWQIAATLGCFINPDFVIELSPYYRFNVIGIKSINSGMEIKNNSFGIQLGLRHYF